jgi:hypothetical protein
MAEICGSENWDEITGKQKAPLLVLMSLETDCNQWIDDVAKEGEPNP